MKPSIYLALMGVALFFCPLAHSQDVFQRESVTGMHDDSLTLRLSGRFPHDEVLDLILISHGDSLSRLIVQHSQTVRSLILRPGGALPPARYWEADSVADFNGDDFTDVRLSAYVPASGLAASREHVIYFFLNEQAPTAFSYTDFSKAAGTLLPQTSDLDTDGISEIVVCDIADWSNITWYRLFNCNVFNYVQSELINVSSKHGFPTTIRVSETDTVRQVGSARYLIEKPSDFFFFKPDP